jgi:Ser/Thr protein kinase RdoA (MazF antagonist)
MANGPGRVFPLPDITPLRLEGGYKNELLRYGDVVSLVEKPSVLVRAYEAVLDWLFDPPALVLGAVHGDAYRGNLLVRDGQIAGPIDWEDARVDWPACELANATWEVCEVGEAVDPARAKAFLAAYATAGGPGEPEAFEQPLRLRLVADLLDSLASKTRGESYEPEHVAHLLRALERLVG